MTTMTHTAILAASRIPAALNASSTIEIQQTLGCNIQYNNTMYGSKNLFNLQLTSNTPTTVQIVNGRIYL